MATEKTEKKDPSAELLNKLHKEHGDVLHIKDPRNGELFVFRAPTREEFELVKSKASKEENAGAVYRELAGFVLVHPEGSAGTTSLDNLFEHAPALPYVLGDELATLAHRGIEIQVKKG